MYSTKETKFIYKANDIIYIYLYIFMKYNIMFIFKTTIFQITPDFSKTADCVQEIL